MRVPTTVFALALCCAAASLSLAAAAAVVIVPGTLTSLDGAQSWGNPLVLASVLPGQRLQWRVSATTTGADADVSTYVFRFGSAATPLAFGCATTVFDAPADNTNQLRVTCTLPAGATGAGLRVTALLPNGTAITEPSADAFSFPAPLVFAVSGCPGDAEAPATGSLSSNATTQCPTEGAPVTLTITGAHFVAPATPTVNGVLCSPATVADAGTRVTCPLPAGTGSVLAVVVTCADQSSPVPTTGTSSDARHAAVLSYALPSITAVTSAPGVCAPAPNGDATAVVDCPREPTAAATITLTGTNFGPLPPTVLIGSEPCTTLTPDPVVPQRQLVCGLPAGTTTARPLLLIQSGGGIVAPSSSSTATLSYRQCGAGYYEDSNAQCQLCALGSASSVPGARSCSVCYAGERATPVPSDACVPCERGQWSRGATTVCHNCTRGTFNGAQRQATCTPCAPGTVAPDDGAASCGACERGTYQRGSGASACGACDTGAYADDLGSTACKACAAGSFANTTASVGCTKCPPGSYQPLTGQSACRLCPAGASSSASGAAACSACDPGTAAPLPGSATCDRCSVGYAQPLSNASACVACSAGSFAAADGSVSCVFCSAGSYSNDSAQSGCAGCAAGTYQPQDGRTSCVACAAGSYSVAGATTCLACVVGTIQPHAGASHCSACPSHSVSLPNRAACQCVRGTVALSLATDTSVVCAPCSSGMTCDRDGLDFTTVTADAGWWRAAVNPNTTTVAAAATTGGGADLRFFQCLSASHCTNGGCAAHREGALCALCAPGYTESSSSDECVACPASQSQSVGAAVGFSILIFFALVVVFAAVWNADGQDALKRSARSGKVKAYTAEDRAAPNFSYNLKIMLSYLQIATALLAVAEIPFPSYFRTFVQYFTFINFSFLPWTNVDCVVSWSFYDKLVLICALPLGVLLVCGGVPYLALTVCDRFDMADQRQTHAQRMVLRRKIMKLIVFALFLAYPSVSSSVLSFFICRSVNGTNYLVADFHLRCGDGEWNRYLPFAIAGVLVYPIGIPLFFFALLWTNRSRLRAPQVLVPLGLLYEAFIGRYWWFELSDMTQKLVLTSLLGFFAPTTQCIVGMVVCTAYCMVLLTAAPYVRQIDDRLSAMAQTHLLLILLCGLVLQQETFVVGSTTDVLASVLLFIVLGVLVALVGFHGIVYARAAVRRRQRAARLQRLGKAPSGGSPGAGPNTTGTGSGRHALERMGSNTDLSDGTSLSGGGGGVGSDRRPLSPVAGPVANFRAAGSALVSLDLAAAGVSIDTPMAGTSASGADMPGRSVLSAMSERSHSGGRGGGRGGGSGDGDAAPVIVELAALNRQLSHSRDSLAGVSIGSAAFAEALQRAVADGVHGAVAGDGDSSPALSGASGSTYHTPAVGPASHHNHAGHHWSPSPHVLPVPASTVAGASPALLELGAPASAYVSPALAPVPESSSIAIAPVPSVESAITIEPLPVPALDAAAASASGFVADGDASLVVAPVPVVLSTEPAQPL